MSLEVKLKKQLGNFLLDVDFSVPDGSATGLLGASGCGKSVTLRCIAGIIRPDEGRIVLNGRTLFDSERRINLAPQKRCVGYLFQNYALFPNMNVEQNIACGLAKERSSAVRKKAVSDMIAKMQLEGLEKHKPFQLSGGQQQRTALARILVGNPEILLLDEPFSALDSYLKDRLAAELKKLLKSFGRDTIMVTHSRDEAYELCETLAILERGRLIGMGDTKRMFQDPGTRSGAVLTGCKNIVTAEKAGDHLVRIPEWGIEMTAAQPVKDELCAIGIRAHFFEPEAEHNVFPIDVVETIEEPFEWTVKFRYEGQAEGSMPVWWRIPKSEGGTCTAPQRLGIRPENILLLYA